MELLATSARRHVVVVDISLLLLSTWRSHSTFFVCRVFWWVSSVLWLLLLRWLCSDDWVSLSSVWVIDKSFALLAQVDDNVYGGDVIAAAASAEFLWDSNSDLDNAMTPSCTMLEFIKTKEENYSEDYSETENNCSTGAHGVCNQAGDLVEAGLRDLRSGGY